MRLPQMIGGITHCKVGAVSLAAECEFAIGIVVFLLGEGGGRRRLGGQTGRGRRAVLLIARHRVDHHVTHVKVTAAGRPYNGMSIRRPYSLA